MAWKAAYKNTVDVAKMYVELLNRRVLRNNKVTKVNMWKVENFTFKVDLTTFPIEKIYHFASEFIKIQCDNKARNVILLTPDAQEYAKTVWTWVEYQKWCDTAGQKSGDEKVDEAIRDASEADLELMIAKAEAAMKAKKLAKGADLD